MDNKSIGIIFLIIVSLVVGPAILIYTESEMNEAIRTSHNETEYQYQILSIQHVNVLIGSDYLIINYMDTNSIVKSLEVDYDDITRVESNQSKLIIRNPEFNGYPREYIVYSKW